MPKIQGRPVRTARVVARCKKYAAGSFSLSNDVTGSWRAEDSVLADEKLLHSVCSANLGDQLHDLRVVESSISTNDEETTFCAFRDRKEDAGDEGLAVVGLLEDGDFLA